MREEYDINIDQKNARAMNVEETREFVSRNLLHASGISMDRIFPVSAYLAYLAKWIECTLAEKGSITVEIDGDHDVIHDFAEKAFGTTWEERVTDGKLTGVESGIRSLWKKSCFDEPMQNVIRFIYEQAAFFALDKTAKNVARKCRLAEPRNRSSF